MFIIPNKVTQARYNNKESIHGVKKHGDNEYSAFYTTESLIKYAENALYQMDYENYRNEVAYDCDFGIHHLHDVISTIDEYGFQVVLDYNNYLANKIGLINGSHSVIFDRLDKEVMKYIEENPIKYFEPEDEEYND